MPQLRGKEQKTLVDLLVGHLTEPGQLDRALLHAELGSLTELTERGTLSAMTANIVRVLSARYKIIEFVDAVLNGDFLQGHCPPIEAWLVFNEVELLRRKNEPTLLERFYDLLASWFSGR